MSKRPRLHVLSLLAISGVLSPAVAKADHDTGLEVAVRPSFGSAGSTSPVVYKPSGTAMLSPAGAAGPIYGNTASPYGGGFIGDASIGLRPIRWVSVGLSGGIRSASASAVDGVTNLSRSAFSAGPYVHAYLPKFVGFEPYVGVGLEYMHDAQRFTQPVSGVPASFDLVHYGIAVPMTVGIDYRFLNYFAVGPSFRFDEVVGAGGCAGASAAGITSSKYCSGDSNPITSAKSYGVWSIGLDLRVTLF